MTFSVTARCAETGMFGVAISSSSPAVAARCAYARAGVGAVASQNVTDPRLGPLLLGLMAEGASAQEAVDEVGGTAEHIDYRQITAVDAGGNAAAFSGTGTLGTWNEALAGNVACAGNILADKAVPERMAEAFAESGGHLGDRLVAVMEAGLAAGGEAGPLRSAGLLLVREVPWPVADLRVDWTEDDPVAALKRLWEMYKPQLDDYVGRALDPAAAPKFGVPGDD